MPFDDESYMEDIGPDYGTESDASLYAAEYDDTLDALMGEDESEGDDMTERRRPRRRRPGRRPPATGVVPPVPMARPGSAYRAPAQSAQGAVSQQQFKDAMARVGDGARRSAMGIKAINARLGQIAGRVDGVVDASHAHATRIVRLNKQMQLDGALDFAKSVVLQRNVTTDNIEIVPDFAQLLQGLVKTGVLGATTGALANPFVVGGIGFLLANSGILLANIVAPRQTP